MFEAVKVVNNLLFCQYNYYKPFLKPKTVAQLLEEQFKTDCILFKLILELCVSTQSR